MTSRSPKSLLLDCLEAAAAAGTFEDRLDAQVVQGGEEVDRLGPAAADQPAQEVHHAPVRHRGEEGGGQDRLGLAVAAGVGERVEQ